ncbi:DUF2202 domain-containing protein [Cryobacterium sp. TmT2-59]|uniref:ferritin-like domain-containing protein n=1 Tax=Cryobacterium sp. TmT2-59 TaxID=1259264 RepID=UPI00106CC333|nr:DUF2202 domain-containing protein [Cryobacterium sp. TmT2-59]TFC84743.1 DUF2202 domain-containing protein [Cryobacterium sp. TmT2-59]
MRKRIIATYIATGAVATALIAAGTVPAIAQNSDARNGDGQGPGAGSGTSTSQPHAHSEMMKNGQENHVGMGDGNGAGTGMGAGNGAEKGTGNRGAGMGAGIADVASGTMTDDEKTAIAAMAEEEKLAHDLYVAFADLYDTPEFSRVAKAEVKHLDAVRTLLERYAVTDPTDGIEAGTFTTDSTQKLYDTLLADGSASQDAALEAARTVEKTDIADLTAAQDGVTAPDVLAVYEHLLAGSERHLVAFGG